jgi:hypothetical protein
VTGQIDYGESALFGMMRSHPSRQKVEGEQDGLWLDPGALLEPVDDRLALPRLRLPLRR